MADHLWTVLCEKYLVDPDNQVISLHDVLESIEEEGLRSRIEEALSSGKKGALVKTPMQLVSWWYRSDPSEESLQVRFVLVNPAGETILEQPIDLPWGTEAATPTTRRIFLRLTNLPVTMLGLHWFLTQQQAVSKKKAPSWVTVARLPLNVDTA